MTENRTESPRGRMGSAELAWPDPKHMMEKRAGPPTASQIRRHSRAALGTPPKKPKIIHIYCPPSLKGGGRQTHMCSVSGGE